VPVDSVPLSDSIAPPAPLLVTAYGLRVARGRWSYMWSIWRRAETRSRNEMRRARARKLPRRLTAGHFIFIPSVMLIGIVNRLGPLGSRRRAGTRFAQELECVEKNGRQEENSSVRLPGRNSRGSA